ncbi:MAG TPA: SCO family protein [Micavibrio sp.]|nr:SCO family protein [Micavibrio sp.]
MEKREGVGYTGGMTKQRFLVLLFAVAAGLVLAGILAHAQKSHMAASGDLIPVTKDAFGGPFTLTDHTGKKVTDKDFTGKYRLIYFGFTYCPAICPTELAKITAALKILGEAGKDIQPIFITVDPERDTAEAMGKYVAMFHPSLVGLTGTPEQIKKVAKDYKIYFAQVQDESMSDYTMDHSSFIYFMAPDDRLLRIFRMEDSAQDMAGIIRRWMQAQ